MAYANAGIPVLLKEVDDAAVERGMATIRKNYESTVAKGRMTPEGLDKTMALITPTTTYDGFDNVDIVVEAVFENMDLKKQIFAELGRVTRPDVHSGVEHVDARHRRVRQGQRPAAEGDRPPFLQPGERDEAARDRARPRDRARKRSPRRWRSRSGSARSASWSATASRSSPTACSRITCARPILLLEEGASVPQIDKAMTDFGMPVGPFGMQDIAGIDVGWRIRQYPEVDRQDARGGTAVGRARSAIRDGPLRAEDRRRLVSDTRQGSRDRIHDPVVDEIAAEEAARRGITRRRVDRRRDHRAHHDGARQRRRARPRRRLRHAGQRHRCGLLLRLRLSAARAAGRCSTPTRVGLPTVLARVKEYREQFGDYWKPAALLEKLAAEGRGFSG